MTARRVLTIGHSYAVSLNRKLATAIAHDEQWQVTVAAPTYFHGTRDLRPVRLEVESQDPNQVVRISAYGTRFVHLFLYGTALRDLLSQKWDLVHCWEEPFVAAGAQIAHWVGSSARLVVVTMQNIPKSYPPPFCAFEAYTMSKAAGWIACGRTVEENLSSRPAYRGVARRVIPLGVDIEQFAPCQARRAATLRELGWGLDGPRTVGFVGRWTPEKGLKLLVEALDQVKVPWRALILGAGPLEPELRSWASGHSDRVRLVNDARHDDVPRYLAAMDCLCAPSQTTPRWREQFGRMLIEAMAAGVVVLGSSSGEIPFVVGDTGELLPENDRNAWVEALGRVLSDDSWRHQMAMKGLARARERYSWSAVGEEHRRFFSELLDC